MATSSPSTRWNWSEYAMEAGETAWLMLAICIGVTVMQAPEFPARHNIANPWIRLSCVSLFMAANIVAINYSPWGKRTGAHYNPAITLAFFRLGKMHARDASGYVLAQLVGGLVGVGLSFLILRLALSQPPIDYVATVPNAWGVGAAFAVECFCSFVLMAGILYCINHKKLAPWTGALAGVFVVFANTLAAPISGFSINPARWFASAFSAHIWNAAWVYLFSAPMGMLLAVELFRWGRGQDNLFCAKLHHDNPSRCIFCEFHHSKKRGGPAAPKLPGTPGQPPLPHSDS